MRDAAVFALLERSGGEVVLGEKEYNEALRQGAYVSVKVNHTSKTITMRNLYKHPVDKKKKKPEEEFAALWDEADEKRMDIIGQNGPSAEHYDEV